MKPGGRPKAFCAWMVYDGRASSNPLKGRIKSETVTDAKIRKALTVADAQTLITKINDSEIFRCNMLGYERAILYRFAIETGLRRSSICALRVEQFEFDAKIVHSEAGQQKNRRPHDVPMRPELVAVLRKHLANKLPKAKAFFVPQSSAEMLRNDMDDAGLDSEGYDFHSLRHTCGSFLAKAGVDLKIVQQVLGHKTFAMTADIYTHLYKEALHQGVQQFPNLEVG